MDFEIRSTPSPSTGGGLTLAGEAPGRPGAVSGYAALFNHRSHPIGGGRPFVEIIKPGAFDESLRGSDPIRARANHQGGLLTLGSTDAGGLWLAADSKGLKFVLDLPNTSAGRDIAELVGKRILKQMSFGFYVRQGGEEWLPGDGRMPLRELHSVKLTEISIVADGAYGGTSVGLAG